MRRARLKITPNLKNLSRNKASIALEGVPLEVHNPAAPKEIQPLVVEEERSSAPEETLPSPPPPSSSFSSFPTSWEENQEEKTYSEKENDEREVQESSEQLRSKKAGFPKSKFIPNLSPSRKRTISSSSNGSSCRTRTISSTFISDLPIEIPVFDQRKADHKKRFNKGVPERSKMTVFDFIFHNPSEGSRMNSQTQCSVPEIVEEITRDEDNPSPIRNSLSDKEDEPVEEDQHMPVPQVKIGPDGQIVLDEDSTFIETTATKKAKEDLLKTSLVYENQSTNYGTWAKKRKNSEWGEKETVRFYKALSIFGTDFSMMASIFKKRDRYDLKMKFKKEERGNRNLVDRCLSQSGQFDLSTIGSESEEEQVVLTNGKKKGPSRKRSADKKSDNTKSKKKRRTSKTLRRSRGYYSSSPSSENEEENTQNDISWVQNASPTPVPSVERKNNVSNSESSILEQSDKDNTFPPGLLAANPGLANATSGSLVVVAASPSPANTNLHVYMVANDKSDNSKSTGRVRTLSSSGTMETPSPRQVSKNDDKRT
uniref:Transcription factor TFIIIB component B'' Myb domain-containing protein n=1 Tax=Lepeophtheirus salmonis TaxID=72036 RepID=A0A0K2U4N2_LEPSM